MNQNEHHDESHPPVQLVNKDSALLLSTGTTGDDDVTELPLWLVVGPTNSNNGKRDFTRRAAVLVSDATMQKESRSSRHALLFPNGCTTQKVATMEELRDALITMFPVPVQQRPQEAQHTQTHKQQLHNNNQYYPGGLNEVKRFELFRSVIQHEDELLNQRVSWIILAQSFLMAAFITSTTAPDSLRLVTAVVGLATVIVTMPAIVAAGRNIEVQQQVYFKSLESDERCQQLHGHTRDESMMEASEIQQRNERGHILPNMAFRSTASLKILYTVVGLATVQFLGWVFLMTATMMDWP